jgi:hypothetical protein
MEYYNEPTDPKLVIRQQQRVIKKLYACFEKQLERNKIYARDNQLLKDKVRKLEMLLFFYN